MKKVTMVSYAVIMQVIRESTSKMIELDTTNALKVNKNIWWYNMANKLQLFMFSPVKQLLNTLNSHSGFDFGW
jgi:hypothetical protein